MGTPHKGDMRDRILDAALHLISSNGLQCSMATIAGKAGVAVGSLYNYFPSKEALLSELYRDVAQAIAEAAPIFAKPERNDAQRVRDYIADYLAFALANPRRIRIVDFLGDLDGFGDAEFGHDFHVLVTENAVRLFGDAQKCGVLRPGDPYILSSFVRGSIRHFVKRHSSNGQQVTAQDIEMIKDMCWCAICAVEITNP